VGDGETGSRRGGNMTAALLIQTALFVALFIVVWRYTSKTDRRFKALELRVRWLMSVVVEDEKEERGVEASYEEIQRRRLEET
jgi:hypothetical protein